jgi:RNA polymerase sigma factor (sigma-70 family)
MPSDDEITELWKAHNEAVFATLWAMTDDSELASEARNEAFMRAIAKWEAVAWRAPPLQRAWLILVAKNWMYDQWRRAKREATKLTLAATQSAPEALTFIAEDVEETADVQGALARITQRQREVLVLSFIAELDNAEVAEVLAISVSAVASSKHRGLQAVRQLLGVREVGEPDGR